jgi:hypothetical protein
MQGTKATASFLHSNVSPGLLEAKVNVPVVRMLGSEGPEVMKVSGGVLLTLTVMALAGV